METQKFTLTFEPTQQNFSTKFTEMTRDFLEYLKNAELLPNCLPELFPETFCGEIIIDPLDPGNEDAYTVDFYTDIKATKKMKEPITQYRNRDITIDEDDETLNFSIRVYKKSGYLESVTEENIILSF
ncbi:MAG: hypothetical protein WCH65_01895 [bacterium]